jgi:hypothetical protein
MNLHEQLNQKIISIFFRVLVILFGVIIVISNDNIFPSYYYFLAIIPYLFLYFKLLFKDGIYSKLRLLNDYAFIVFIIYNKGVQIDTVTFSLLPILNSPNHSGTKKSWILYALTFLTIISLTAFSTKFNYFASIFIIYLIGLLVDARFKYFQTMMELSTSVDSYLESFLNSRKGYKIYEGILGIINRQSIIPIYRPKFKGIVCFKVINNDLKLINSSYFIWNYQFENINLDELQSSSSSPLRINIKLNDEISNHQNLIVDCTYDNSRYLFVVLLDENSQKNDLFDPYYVKLLQTTFIRVARSINTEWIQELEHKKFLMSYREKYFYIQNAEKAMHFIKNKFSPLSNYIEMSEDFIENEMDSTGLEIYQDELTKAKRNFGEIIKRANSILKKSHKPFNAIELKPKGLKYIFSTVRSIWTDYFPNFTYSSTIELDKEDNLSFQLNTDGFTILLVDWLNNMNKYSSGKEIVNFSETIEDISISFVNQIGQTHSSEVKKLVSDFNSSDRGEILKRKSHGVIIMQSLLEEMNFKGKMTLDNLSVTMMITIPKQS